ncbi:MAG: UDP-N-acetylmuramate--L-alanine ligase [Firmicutes bacterium]|nr:UDP-N-acetylmuramate--L-alanine ligase [Bacillota bacterium]
MERFKTSDLNKNAHIHFIGIGGISMSGLAQIALQRGYNVSGSDRTASHITDKLEKLGAKIYIGHDAKNVAGADLAVHTAAVKDDNPEMAAARENGIRLIDRAEFLGAIMQNYRNAVNVAGTHGKTTTTSMLAHALIYSELDPTISLGGELDLIDGNIRTGSSDYFVAEACEYTNSFLKFCPTIALITNIEADHLDFFSGIDEIIESFRKFALLTKDKGKVIAMGEDENIKKALDGTDLDITTYGFGKECDIYPENLEYKAGYPSFDVCQNGKKLCHLQLNVPGGHNVLNALATIGVCVMLGADAETAAKGIETFKGTHRRFEKKGFVNGAIVIDDYAHHPTEIKATLKAAKEFPHSKIRCIFQPHTYSRTRTLWNEFTQAFDDADELILTHIYAAREIFDGVTKPENLAEEIRARGVNARYIDDFGDIAEYIKSTARENEIIFTMGAGDVTEIGEMLVK